MPTTIQRERRAGVLPGLVLAADISLGHSDTSTLLMRQIHEVERHVLELQHGTFFGGTVYVPFLAKRSFEIRPRYRFTGRMPFLPLEIDD